MSHSIWRPYTQHALAEPPIEITSASSAYLTAGDGTQFLDMISSWWVNIHGHCHPKIVKAVSDQSARLEQVIFAGFTHPTIEELSVQLLQRAPPSLKHVFYSDNGSTAVEVALKMAISYWKNIEGSSTSRKRIVAFDRAYHGDTFGAMSVSSEGAFVSPYREYLFSVDRISSVESEMVPSFKNLISIYGKQSIAALILEPLVLGAGGMVMYSPQVLKQLSELCVQNGILLIADEVMTGFGRVGSFFACEKAEVEPDLMCLSKGITGGFLPLGATLCKEKVFESFYSKDRTKTFFHGHSYSGNALSAAAALASLKIFEEEPVFERIKMIEDAHTEGLASLRSHPRVKTVRQMGTIAALELSASDDERGYLSEIGSRLQAYFLKQRILLRPLGNVLYLMPPYCIKKEEISRVYGQIHAGLEEVGK